MSDKGKKQRAERHQIEIGRKQYAFGRSADGGERNASCDGPGNQSRDQDDAVLHIDCEALTGFQCSAELVREHGGERLIAGDH